MELKIGQIFQHNKKWYQCVEGGDGCKNCAFYDKEYSCCDTLSPDYYCCDRSDGKDVIFKELEKVGEPFIIVGKLYQYYKVFDIDNVCGDGFWCVHNYKAKTLTIEIKQNKEDMKEYRMHDAREDIPEFDKIIDECLFGEDKLNLKPFSIEAAKAGKPVCTRDGRKARIIYFDAEGNKPLIVLSKIDGKEVILRYTEKGQSDNFHSITPREDDLMMLPEKKEGWINVYKGGLLDTKSYSTKKEAFGKACPEGYVDTVKICWEE